MSTREELEQALRSAWNLADLAVYADHLRGLGDPRGELIALDLAPRHDGAWSARRRELLEAWLGASCAARFGRLVQHGVVHELRDRDHVHTHAVLDGPLGGVVRGFSTWSGHDDASSAATVLQTLERVAAQPRPWLTRLAIDYSGTVACDPALCDRLIAATPNLVELYTLGERLFESFRHPSLRTLYVTPLFQRAERRGIPETAADVIELTDYGYPSMWFAKQDDVDAVRTFLAAIDGTADVNELYATYGDLVQPHDSLPAVVVRLAEAGLVTLDGPFVYLTAIGDGLLRGGAHRAPPRLPPADLDNRKWVLWASTVAERAITIGLLHAHGRFLAACLARMPIDADTYATIVDYLACLCDVVAGGEATKRTLSVEPHALLAALRELIAFRRLTDYHIEMFDDARDEIEWLAVENLVTLLAALPSTRQPMFWVAWGL